MTGRKGKPPRDENDKPIAQPLLYQTGDVIGMVVSFPEDPPTQEEQPEGQEDPGKDKGTAVENGGENTTKTTEVTGTLAFHRNGVAVEGARMEGIRPGVHFAVTVYNSSEARLRILPAGGL